MKFLYIIFFILICCWRSIIAILCNNFLHIIPLILHCIKNNSYTLQVRNIINVYFYYVTIFIRLFEKKVNFSIWTSVHLRAISVWYAPTWNMNLAKKFSVHPHMGSYWNAFIISACESFGLTGRQDSIKYSLTHSIQRKHVENMRIA
jgi:hypothetical protein